MVRNERSATALRELAQFARSQTLEGVLVRARCFAVTGTTDTRFEIVIDANGQFAVIDVSCEGELAPRMDQAMASFALAARVRAGLFQ